jgi:hypothetical protein
MRQAHEGKAKPFSTKHNMTHYPEYKDPSDYTRWIAEVAATLGAHGCEELLDPNYAPNPNDEFALRDWKGKQAFGYMMLQKKVRTITGKRIVDDYRYSRDAQRVFQEIHLDAHTSTEAVLSNRDLLSKIASLQYDGRGRPAVEFITIFHTMMDQYNEKQLKARKRLSDEMMKEFLQAAVASVTMLADVSNQDQQIVARGARELTYTEYLSLLKSAASTYDRKRAVGRRSDKITVLTHDSTPQDVPTYDAN